MLVNGAAIRLVLLVKSPAQAYALPLAEVAEVMRPLPLKPIAGAPPFVLGLAIVRGAPVPVLDLDVLFAAPAGAKTRLVTLRLGERCVALAVAEVLGVRAIAETELRELPPLLSSAYAPHVEQLGRLDGHLFMLLQTARLLPENTIAARQAP